MRAPENWRAQGVRERAVGKPLRRRTVDASLCSVRKRSRNDAVESTVRSRAGSQIALLRISRAR
eukprot:7428653-Lingulodinium_polyedra.AAC.1